MRKFYPPLPPAALIRRPGVRCQKCRYELRTLAVTGRCPECGMSVRQSLGLGPARVRRLIAGITPPRHARLGVRPFDPAAPAHRLTRAVAVAAVVLILSLVLASGFERRLRQAADEVGAQVRSWITGQF